jgi:uncharacterized protein (TIGR02246 family)
MSGRKYVLVVLVLAGGVAVAAGFRDRPVPQEKGAPGALDVPGAIPLAAQPPAKAEGAEAGIKAITAEYAKAFNAGDAKAAAGLWTTEGEYIGADGEVHSGRAAIEKGLAEFFKANPKATVEIEVENVRIIGRGTASCEGVVKLKAPGTDTPDESWYTALHVLEDGKWHAASVREYVPDPSTEFTLKAMEWIIGEWTAKGPDGEVKLTYKWDANKVFIRCDYEITKDGKRVSHGTQVIGKNPGGGLRTWTFDSSGTTSDGLWVRDGTRWLNEATGLTPDGFEITSLNVVVPISADVFTWQTTDRASNGVPLPALPPIKVTRVKK